MIGVAIIGLVACLHSEGLSRELADGSSPTADPEALGEGTASVSTGSPAGLDPESSVAERSPVDDEDGAVGGLEEPTQAASGGSTATDAAGSGAMTKESEEAAGAPQAGRSGGEVRSAVAGETPKNTAPEPGAGDSNPEDGSRAEASPTPSVPAESEIPGPATSMATLLGTRRQRLEGRLRSDGVEGDGGWVHYGAGLAVRYESGRAVEAALRVPAGLTCVEAARWAGFRRAMPPLYRAGGCSWPGISARHRIHRGVVGELAQATGILQFWSTKASR